MKALIAFILMAVVILVLIEINERIKAKKAKGESQTTPDNCPQDQTDLEDCSGCGLVDVCEKKPSGSTAE